MRMYVKGALPLLVDQVGRAFWEHVTSDDVEKMRVIAWWRWWEQEGWKKSNQGKEHVPGPDVGRKEYGAF